MVDFAAVQNARTDNDLVGFQESLEVAVKGCLVSRGRGNAGGRLVLDVGYL